MTPTWQTVTDDDGDAWLELDVSPHLFVVVRFDEHERGYYAKLIHRDEACVSPAFYLPGEAQQEGIAMLSQYLFDIASEAMTLAGAE